MAAVFKNGFSPNFASSRKWQDRQEAIVSLDIRPGEGIAVALMGVWVLTLRETGLVAVTVSYKRGLLLVGPLKAPLSHQSQVLAFASL